jgi:uncharacterized membrane protein YcaP (DUF421 family)
MNTQEFWLNLIFIFIRSSLVYLVILLLMRIFKKRELTQLSVVDLILILLISNAVQNAMTGPDTTLEGGIVAALALFTTNLSLKKLLDKFPRLDSLFNGEPMMLIYQGKIKTDNLKKSGISKLELETACREHGVKSIEEVDLAILEIDGNISVLSNDFKNRSRKRRR